ncbi:uncharacterized protein CLUP02_14815 [Colletotrichum lupini]|uniref:Uncharacterized protein n=1 Tax=Colletotrichum lupini TaxID=145971 RepID=A0A9Q8WN29_9PEZI|nr:uncharacterized protein CLUP02_14815 [Colletotrichum lupini]UQC89286.1 hypothetical protein CLUP02_14815 [Colletotrichum lupini]
MAAASGPSLLQHSGKKTRLIAQFPMTHVTLRTNNNHIRNLRYVSIPTRHFHIPYLSPCTMDTPRSLGAKIPTAPMHQLSFIGNQACIAGALCTLRPILGKSSGTYLTTLMGRALTWPLAHASAAPRSSFASILQPSIIERPSLHRTLLLLRISASTEVASSVRPQANSNELHPWSTWTRYNHFVTHIFVLVRSTQRVRLGLKPAPQIVNGELPRYSTTADPGRYRHKRSLRLPKASASKTIQPRLCRLSPECGVPGISRIHVRIRPSLAFFKDYRSVANEYPFQVLFKSKTSRTIRREQRLPNPQPLRSPFEKQDPIVLHHGGKPIPLDICVSISRPLVCNSTPSPSCCITIGQKYFCHEVWLHSEASKRCKPPGRLALEPPRVQTAHCVDTAPWNDGQSRNAETARNYDFITLQQPRHHTKKMAIRLAGSRIWLKGIWTSIESHIRKRPKLGFSSFLQLLARELHCCIAPITSTAKARCVQQPYQYRSRGIRQGRKLGQLPICSASICSNDRNPLINEGDFYSWSHGVDGLNIDIGLHRQAPTVLRRDCAAPFRKLNSANIRRHQYHCYRQRSLINAMGIRMNAPAKRDEVTTNDGLILIDEMSNGKASKKAKKLARPWFVEVLVSGGRRDHSRHVKPRTRALGPGGVLVVYPKVLAIASAQESYVEAFVCIVELSGRNSMATRFREEEYPPQRIANEVPEP